MSLSMGGSGQGWLVLLATSPAHAWAVWLVYIRSAPSSSHYPLLTSAHHPRGATTGWQEAHKAPTRSLLLVGMSSTWRQRTLECSKVIYIYIYDRLPRWRGHSVHTRDCMSTCLIASLCLGVLLCALIIKHGVSI